jgi:hypothetical protein
MATANTILRGYMPSRSSSWVTIPGPITPPLFCQTILRVAADEGHGELMGQREEDGALSLQLPTC